MAQRYARASSATNSEGTELTHADPGSAYFSSDVPRLVRLALLLRFFLQLVRAPARNPLSQFLAALTDFIVRPARRVIPGLVGAST